MDKTLITGTDGFIGGNLATRFKNPLRYDEKFQDQDWKDNLWEYLFCEPAAIFHVGACSDTLETNVNYMMVANYESTKILSDYAKEKGIPFIYSSSAANYGINGEYPSNLYGWSKYVAEDYVLKNGGVALRYFNVYGNGERKKGRMASVAYQAWLFNKKNPEKEFLLYPGDPLRDFVYIEDVVAANLFALKNFHKLAGRYYEVGSGEARSFEDVLTLMKVPFSVTKENIPDGYQFFTCSDKKKWMPGWKPSFTIDTALPEYFKKLENL